MLVVYLEEGKGHSSWNIIKTLLYFPFYLTFILKINFSYANHKTLSPSHLKSISCLKRNCCIRAYLAVCCIMLLSLISHNSYHKVFRI